MFNYNEELKSYFNLTLGLKKSVSDEIENKFLKPKIDNFFFHKNIKNYQLINTSKLPVVLDFNLFSMEYYYDLFFSDIKKVNGEIIFNIKYGLTLDEEICKDTCEKTGLKFGEFRLYKKPVFYYIFIDIKDIFSFIKNNINADYKYYNNLKA
jgi:hypothetical protein